jgi:signal peptidase
MRHVFRLTRTLLKLTTLLAMTGVLLSMGAAAIPNLLGYKTLVVLSGSMGDAMPIGSVAITRVKDETDIRVGDVMVVPTTHDGSVGVPITHRVIDITSKDGALVFWTKGDANIDADAQGVTLTGGKAPVLQRYIPYAGYVIKWAGTPAGWALMVLLPAAIVLILLMRGIWRADKPLPVPHRVVAGATDRARTKAAAKAPTGSEDRIPQRAIPYASYVTYATTAGWALMVLPPAAIVLIRLARCLMRTRS